MRPVSIRFQGFGPYVTEQFIDFAPLSARGIFLICGETGAGKTTILDAICYALYGRSSGGARGELDAMRCEFCRPEDPTVVEYIFDLGEKRYRFTREIRQGRRGSIVERHDCAVFTDGVFAPLIENPKKTTVSKKAEEILGLSYEQFRQVVILPQGQFEKLLVSDSEEKEKILSTLFGTGRWAYAADEIRRRVKEKDDALKSEYNAILGTLAAFSCGTVDELGEKTAAMAEREKELEARAGKCAKELENAAGDLEKALGENADFAELERRKKALAGLEARITGMQAEKAALSRADAAERVRPLYDEYKRLADEKKNAGEALDSAKTAHERALSDAAALDAEKKKISDSEETMRRVGETLVRFRDARAVYAGFSDRQNELAAAEKAVLESGKKLKDAEDALKLAGEDWRKKCAARDETITALQRANHIYNRTAAGRLAGELREGEPCPVCGSIHHPAPAVLDGDEKITEKELETLNRALDKAALAVTKADQARVDAEETKKTALDADTSAKTVLAAAKTALESARAGLFPDIPDTDALEGKIRKYETSIANFEAAKEKVSIREKSVTSDLAKASANLDSAVKRLADAEKAADGALSKLNEALISEGFRDENDLLSNLIAKEVLDERKKSLYQFAQSLTDAQTALAEQEQKVSGRTAPDIVSLRAAKESAEKALDATGREHAVVSKQHSDMAKAHAALTGRVADYSEKRKRTDADIVFAKRLSPSSGLSLQRYVLGVMLTTVTAAANRLLESVHGGRYRLYRTDDTSGGVRKAGLELEVLDNACGGRRSVRTLSGGEKFLVALSLAIGLSTVVQSRSGGTKLEAMFIDEGFGSLDAESINDALAVLSGIQRTHGLVGIISHVDRLRETIPARLEIEKNEGGSGIKVIGV